MLYMYIIYKYNYMPRAIFYSSIAIMHSLKATVCILALELLSWPYTDVSFSIVHLVIHLLLI